jgi:hypothetical protein
MLSPRGNSVGKKASCNAARKQDASLVRPSHNETLPYSHVSKATNIADCWELESRGKKGILINHMRLP